MLIKELIFADQLFDALDYLGVEMLPTNIASPHKAIAKLKEYIEKELPQDYEEIKNIFVKENLSGDYSKFRAVVAGLEKVRVESPFSNFMHIKRRLKDPSEKFVDLAKKFCEFADVKIN